MKSNLVDHYLARTNAALLAIHVLFEDNNADVLIII
jgi:hypothetical protein